MTKLETILKEFKNKWCKGNSSGFLGTFCHIDDVSELLTTVYSSAKEEVVVELQKIIDKNTVYGCYSPDGISKDLIMFVGVEAIKSHLTPIKNLKKE